ncbi:glycerophosphodiester phosphodiesterase family protein [Bacillus sp. FJAT-50079]|uniref:glycerophosphodiester phosphodiesterase family protein n=1 Tax=Bacillus sp. FJAT-50079 TaxID=2833577 RepID=UPI001BC95902|nr:glycerophosphodiester phosphodiesterase family protein [Bacillus sp. FJAT-50079]MBS4208409.1 glycerophosphodiester phosphodiesterase family protein [Bacillus sp. FJAT-50079]
MNKEKYVEINEVLNQKLANEPFLIVSHRGAANGNIVENTIPSTIAAYQSGSDIVEIDVIKSVDSQFYVFHDGNEKRLLNETRNIKELSSHEIDALNYYNSNYKQINYKVEKLEAVLNKLEKNQLINIDRSWDDWETLLPYLDQFQLEQQILLKSPVDKEYLDALEVHETKYMYFPIVKTMEELEIVQTYSNINLVGVELIAENQNSPLFQDDLIEQLREQNLFVFANAIRLDDETILFGELDDDLSIVKGPEYGWGKIIEKGCNVIQTDWTSLLNDYRMNLKQK